MPSCLVHEVTLTCHPETPSGAVRVVGARVGRMPGGALAVTYIFEGDLDQVRVPLRRPPRVAGRLWQHTCCEIFIARKGVPTYHEFNLSPSGEWAGYEFACYRNGVPFVDESNVEELNPHVTVHGAARKLELDALIRLDRLSPMHLDATLSLALSAVVEDQDGSLSYWALRHPAGKPDFHHTDAFALELARTAPSQAHSPE